MKPESIWTQRLTSLLKGFKNAADSIARFRTRKDLRMLLPGLQSLYNEAIIGTDDNFPITAEEARIMANQILWFSDPFD